MVTTPPAVADLPTTPNPTMSAPVFGAAAYAWSEALPAFSDQHQALAAAGHANALAAEQAAATSTAQSLAAIDAKNAAEQAVVAASAVSGATQWTSGSYTTGAVVWSPSNGQNYRRKSPGGASPTDPANDPTNWYSLVNLQGLSLVTISTNTVAVAGRHYVITAPCQLTLPASPNANDRVGFTDVSLTRSATINPNGGKIRDVAEVMTLNTNYAEAVLIASGGSQGWI